MRERKLCLFQCKVAEHSVRLTYMNQMDPWKRRPVHQQVVYCSFKTENLCKVELYPPEGESQCPAVKLAVLNQLR